MENYKSGSHTRHDLKVHLVWSTKYRKAVLFGEVALRVRELIREICAVQEVTILKGHVSKDHVHLFVGYPPHLAVSKLVQRLKGKSLYALLSEYTEMRRKFWGQRLWARGYFAASSGNVTDEVVMGYIAGQDQERSDDEFRVGEEPR
ncbi:MAG: IS200/IS605 family transposase [Opitutaceae bacterium]|nr:IS200/IS605 family transposase [Opitutaceae bacterium]